MENFGTLGFFFIILIPIYVLEYFVNCFKCKCYCCRLLGKKLARLLYWNTILRMLIESYIICMICWSINIRYLDFKSEVPWTVVNSILTAILSPILLLFPFVGAILMYKNFGILNSLKTKMKFGELYQGFNI